ncbi:putative dual specificity protein phosphatase DSP8 [Heracleum sosnowskyi]|uniref:phosphatidylglycerophosphatase n=1 Tax=Heracleum sosnowskyi TaxID=360622 RepID=A0AAD8MLD3_9APIA|nr:putative dual specificity protein phosphatase DSP8 [Heracleum sosnowskyi]
MYIKEWEDGVELEEDDEEVSAGEEVLGSGIVMYDAKRALVGAGARALFYPTLLYNVVRNKIQTEFRWWDRIDEFLLLGAVPFPSDVKRLKELGVCGVITLNESYETLVPTSLYQANDIDHLVLPTRDYLFAPSLIDISRAVSFIHENTDKGKTTYVHCKAGRGRSTTIVICYLVQHKQMKPDDAYDYVKSIRPRVLLAPAQLQAVHEYYNLKVQKLSNPSYKKICKLNYRIESELIPRRFFTTTDVFAFDDGSVVLVTSADLDGYDPNRKSGGVRRDIWGDMSVVYRVRHASQTALTRLSCLWLRHNTNKVASEQMHQERSCVLSNQVGGFTVNIHLY